jgi:hypothetical protein
MVGSAGEVNPERRDMKRRLTWEKSIINQRLEQRLLGDFESSHGLLAGHSGEVLKEVL